MLLHREIEGDGCDGAAAAAWLRPETLDTLQELNELGLSLLAEQALARGAAACPLLREVSQLWRMLDAAARHRAAACPYLLLDAGFADAARWQTGMPAQVGDAAEGTYAAFFTVTGAKDAARLVFTYGWHLARAQPAAARLLLGMTTASAALIGRYTLRQIQALAERRPDWLKPRWPTRVQVWRELLLAAAVGEGAPLERARLRGLTLLAAEGWRATAPAAATRSLQAVAGRVR
jgi:hypothetical protein